MSCWTQGNQNSTEVSEGFGIYFQKQQTWGTYLGEKKKKQKNTIFLKKIQKFFLLKMQVFFH